MNHLDEPLESYKNHFQELHHQNVYNYFEEMVKTSGVDVSENNRLVGVIEQLKSAINKIKKRLFWFKFLNTTLLSIGIIIILGGLFLYFYLDDDTSPNPIVEDLPLSISSLIIAIVFIIISVTKLFPKIKAIKGEIKGQETELKSKIDEAWQLLTPLHNLFDWNIASRLVNKTMPQIQLDEYVANGRLNELINSFDLNTKHFDERSTLVTHSGEINGNPFVISKSLGVEMQLKTYTGYKTITYRERCTDSNGKTYYETRTQTLSASVDKPAPVYDELTCLIYGNDAAPTLTFTRNPSDLSNAKDSFFGNMAKKSKIKELQKLSRNLNDDLGFTMMQNQEFEALFHAIDRNDETQFRLLFTALAQQQMLKLLKDKEIGFGDDFTFLKENKSNILLPKHLNTVDLNPDPKKFKSYSIRDMKSFFISYHNAFFKSIYFTLAPLLVIPLYRQMRTHDNIYKCLYDKNTSDWENESIANHFGYNKFAHPASETKCILKAKTLSSDEDSNTIEVTAHSYKTIMRTEYVKRYGNDGYMHDVPVEWPEYIPIKQSSRMVVSRTKNQSEGELANQDNEERDNLSSKWHIDPNKIKYYKTLFFFIKK